MNITTILMHDIHWYLDDEPGKVTPEELDECSIEHIEKCIQEGYREGELFVSDPEGDQGDQFSGWWSIGERP